MSYQSTWDIAVNIATSEFSDLDKHFLARTEQVIRDIQSVKCEITSLFDAVNGIEICRLCRGECCQTGCFHFTVIDLLAYLITDRELFTPRFDSGTCPYLGETGCLMEPSYRPYNCITFVCDRVDTGMDPALRCRFSELSSTLKNLCQNMEALFANRFLSGILNNGIRFIEGRSQGILWSKNVDN